VGDVRSFFVALDDVAMEYIHDLVDVEPGDLPHSVAAASLTLTEMTLLLHVTRGGTLDGDDDVNRLALEFAEVFNGGLHGPWLIGLPTSLVTILGAASKYELDTFTAEWARAEEVACIHQDTLRSILQSLSDLARTAQADDQTVCLWSNCSDELTPGR
jgi:hypothetical protein